MNNPIKGSKRMAEQRVSHQRLSEKDNKIQDHIYSERTRKGPTSSHSERLRGQEDPYLRLLTTVSNGFFWRRKL